MTTTASPALTTDDAQALVAALDGLPAFLSIPEAAHVMGMSRSAAYRAVERGELPTVTLSGRLRVPVGALLKLMGLMHNEDGIGTPWARTVLAAAH